VEQLRPELAVARGHAPAAQVHREQAGRPFDGILEVFNVFNRTNYGSWVTNEGNAKYGQPTDNNNIAFMPRLMQLGFRTTF
jgi:hypothetical protein